ncbi:MAG: YitT family protein [Planctomycetes bacterium]|nr:YitT family protein [Planctomycetota bacterium]
MSRSIREALNAVLIVFGILSAGMGLNGFLLSSNFIDGGVTGVSMLLAKMTKLPLAIWLPVVNLPFIALGYQQIGRAFAIRSILAIAGLTLGLAVIPYPDVTPDLVLTAVFGGFFIGSGIGLAMRGGAVLDGTEIAALLVSKRSHLLSVGDVILLFNILLFVVAIFVLGVEPALYSILTYLTAAKTLDFVLHGIDEYTAITIMSERSAAIRERITHELGRGVTIYKGHGGMTGHELGILYCVITRLEIGKVKTIVREIDPAAFVVFHPLAGAEGGRIKRTTLH